MGALSQYPSPNGEISNGDCVEIAMMRGSERRASMCKPITWSEIVSESASDPIISQLASTIQKGFPSMRSQLSTDLTPFWNIRNLLDFDSGVV